jgi:hypothetical protein
MNSKSVNGFTISPLTNQMCLDPLAKLRKATVSFVMSVCPSASNKSVPTKPLFVKFDI